MSHIFLHKSIGALLGLIVALAQASPARDADGSLNPTFGNRGIVAVSVDDVRQTQAYGNALQAHT